MRARGAVAQAAHEPPCNGRTGVGTALVAPAAIQPVQPAQQSLRDLTAHVRIRATTARRNVERVICLRQFGEACAGAKALNACRWCWRATTTSCPRTPTSTRCDRTPTTRRSNLRAATPSGICPPKDGSTRCLRSIPTSRSTRSGTTCTSGSATPGYASIISCSTPSWRLDSSLPRSTRRCTARAARAIMPRVDRDRRVNISMTALFCLPQLAIQCWG